jgi:peptidoglycan hydrolase-like protein with peptidoglycan-binding domain
MNPKTILTEDGWDEVAPPTCKGKDKELRSALMFYWSLEDDDFDFRCKALVKIVALAGKFKTAKEVTGCPDKKVVDVAVKHLTDVINASKAKQAELTKAKAEAGKAKALAAKTEALTQKKSDEEAKKREEEEEEGEEEEEEEEGDSFKKLTSALKTLKLSKKPYYFLVCDAKPYGLVISKKDIRKNAQARKELAQIAGGSTRPPKVGECRCDGGKYVFEMEKPPSGLARILQKWIKDNTGLGVKVMVGTESAEDEEEPKTASVEAPTAQTDAAAGAGQAATGEREDRPSGAAAPSRAAEPQPGRPTPAQSAAEAASTTGMTAPFSISASVGRGGKNKSEDVEAVQAALNQRAKAGLTVDGKCGPKTIAAIMAFQKQLGFASPDGLVDVGKQTATGLAGGKVVMPEKPAKGGGGGGGSGKPAGSGGKGTGTAEASVFGVVIGGIIGGAVAAAEAAIRAAQQAEARKKAAEQSLQEVVNKLKKAAEAEGGDEGKQIRGELEKARQEYEAHKKKLEQAARDLAKRKTAEAAEALKKAAENSVPGFKTLEDLVKRAGEWLEKNAPNIGEDPTDLAKRVAKEVADRKQQAEKAYNDAIQKLKKAMADQAGDEGKTIQKELQDAYNEARKHLKTVEDAAKQLARRKSTEAVDALKKAAELTVPGFKAVEEQAQKAWDWAQQNGPTFIDDAKELAKKVAKEVAEKKKQADDAYKGIIDKMKKAADDELGDEGKQIKKELQDAYQQAQEHAKNVAKAAKELAQRKTQEAADALKTAAENTVPGFKTVEDLSQKALDWWNS